MIELCKFHYAYSPDTWKVVALDSLDNMYFMLELYVYMKLTNILVAGLSGLRFTAVTRSCVR